MITPELVLSLGREDFIEQLTKAIGAVLPIDHVSLFIFDHSFIPHYVAGVSCGKDTITTRLSALYENSFYYHHDPNLKWIEKTQPDNSDENNIPLIQQMHAVDIKNESYRINIYDNNGLLDRLSLIDHDKQKWFILNLYRDVGHDYFNEKDIDNFRDAAVLMAAFVKQHLSFCPSLGWDIKTIPPIEKLERIVASLESGLSKREIEVCARVMQGLTREAVSLDLGIKLPTVATFMRRAYSKLNISSLNELFALCLAQTNVIPDQK